MKKILFVYIVTFLFSMSVFAQNEYDALRYANYDYLGTARFVSMAGAFGALGADASVLSTNPAGIAVFRHSQITISPVLKYSNVKSGFYGESRTDDKYHFGATNFGFIAASVRNGKIKAVNFGFAYNKLADFSRNITINGVNTDGSLLDYFMFNSDGTFPDDLNSYGEFLAWDTYLLDTLNTYPDPYLYTNPHWWNTNEPVYGQTQRRIVQESGKLDEYAFSAGFNYNNRVYMGMTIGVQGVRYKLTSTHTEIDEQDKVDYSSFVYQEHLNVEGTGINMKLGLIVRPFDFVRIGAAVHTPTFFSMQDNYSSSIDSYWDEPIGNYSEFSSQSPNGLFTYSIREPFRAIGSVAFIIKKWALINVDYEYVDYTAAKITSDDYDFFAENEAVKSLFTKAQNIRAGAEINLNPFTLRAGYALLGAPVKAEDLNYSQVTVISGGAGFRTSSFFIDLAYSQRTGSQNYVMYYPVNKGEQIPTINEKSSFFVMTVGFRF